MSAARQDQREEPRLAVERDPLAVYREADRPLPVVLDTDTDNEIDDQFALVYAMLCPEMIDLQACYAAPYHNSRSSGAGDGMEKSYHELLRMLDLIAPPARPEVFRGAEAFLGDTGGPVSNPAVEDLTARALARPADSPLWVVAIGAPTNIATALLLEPTLAERIVLLWLGGHPLDWPDAKEFNLKQDLPATRALLESPVPLLLSPCQNVAGHLRLSLPEAEAYLRGRGELADYLLGLMGRYPDMTTPGWSKTIWDLAPVAWLIQPDWLPSVLVPRPGLTDEYRWDLSAGSSDPGPMRILTSAHRNEIFRDFFARLAGDETKSH